MTLTLREQTAQETVALGASLAERHMSPVAKAVATGKLSPGSLVVLDFSGLTAVNASYIKGTAFWLFTCGRMSTQPAESRIVPRHPADPRPFDLYVCLSGLTEELEEEFQEFLKPRGVPMLLATSHDQHEVFEACVLGSLDSTLEHTLRLLAQRESATAPELHEANQSEGVTVTAWNNRLNDLNTLRLARRARSGRSWIYKSIARKLLWE